MFYKVGFNWLVKERLATIYWWQFVSADFFAKSLDSWNCCWMHCPASLELATKWAVLITQDVDRHSNSAKKWLLFQTSVMMPHYQMVGSEFKFMRSLKEAIMAKKHNLLHWHSIAALLPLLCGAPILLSVLFLGVFHLFYFLNVLSV